MKKLNSIKCSLSVFVTGCLLMFGCNDDEPVARDQQIINQLLTDSLLNIVEDFDIAINRGTNPPSLENTYFVSPRVLENSNRPSDNIGMSFTNLTFQITDQNNADLTFSFFGRQGTGSTSSGLGGFVIGDGNLFTLFVEQTNIQANNIDSAKVVNVYSGELIEGGIRDFKQLLVLTDDFGDPNDIFIAIGESRLIVDSDGISPVVNENLTGGRVSTFGNDKNELSDDQSSR